MVGTVGKIFPISIGETMCKYPILMNGQNLAPPDNGSVDCQGCMAVCSHELHFGGSHRIEQPNMSDSVGEEQNVEEGLPQ